jgi:coiled-coil domain-containing protein 130
LIINTKINSQAKKKEIKASEEKDNAFLKKCSLDIPLLGESEDDKRIASLIRLQPSKSKADKIINGMKSKALKPL